MEKWATPGLLLASSVFMTFAWYGHLKQRDRGIVYAVLVSWGIAFFEYCLMVPANRMGYGAFTGFQLKIMQEVITLSVFIVFARVCLGEALRWNYAVAIVLIFAAVLFAFWE
ncbi:MAG: DMT family protein [Acidobacteria bacterium]|nr:DMT family protein [Acidobacteriota bacterium]